MKVSNFKLDWLSFTYKKGGSACLIDDFFLDFPELAIEKPSMVICKGRKYEHGLALEDNLIIQYDDDCNLKGVNVQIPSHGLSYFFSLFDVKTVQDMFRVLFKRGCKPSRIDICFDDFSKKYRPSLFYSLMQNHKDYKLYMDWLSLPEADRAEIPEPKKPQGSMIITKMRKFAMFSSSDGVGETFYLGDRRKRMLRIYDKCSESGGALDCIRYEVEVHEKQASSLFYHIINSNDSDVVAFGDYLNTIFDIREINYEDYTITRWVQNSEWSEFLKSTFSQRFITIPKYSVEESIERTEQFIITNCYSAFYFMIAKHGLSSVLKAVKERGLSDRYKVLLHKWERSNNLPPDSLLKNCLLNY